MRHRHRKEVALSVKLSSSRAVKTCGTLSSGTTVFCKYLFGEAKIATIVFSFRKATNF